jgi:hypothetical protein
MPAARHLPTLFFIEPEISAGPQAAVIQDAVVPLSKSVKKSAVHSGRVLTALASTSFCQ